MIRYGLFLSILIYGLLSISVFGMNSESILLPYSKTVLENGLTIIVKEVHATPLAAVDVWVGTGAVNESPEETGISHFFEHMIFKGTAKRSVGQFSQEIQGVGGYLNAATSLDTTHYYIVVPSESIDLALDAQADAIQNSIFDPGEIDKERQVIMEEMRLKEDNPQKKLSWAAYRQLFVGTPYANDVLGTPESLAGITRETFLNYHRKRYVANNMVVVVTGDVNTADVISKISRLFNGLKPGKIDRLPEIDQTVLDHVKRVELQMEVEQTYLYMGFPGTSLYHQDTPVLNILGVIMGGGKSSRLYQELREEKKLVSTIGSGYQAYQKMGIFAIYAETRETEVNQIEKTMTASLRKIATEGVTQDELNRAKRLIQSYLAYDLETNAGKAAFIGEFEVGGSLEDAVNYEKRLAAVTTEDIQKIAVKYFLSGYVWVSVKPEGGKS